MGEGAQLGETIGWQYWGGRRLRDCKYLCPKWLGEYFYDGPAEGVLRMVALVLPDLGLLCRDESGGVTGSELPLSQEVRIAHERPRARCRSLERLSPIRSCQEQFNR